MARRRRLAMLAATALAVGGVTLPAGPAQAAPACDVVYATNDWGSGFTANVTIKNLGDAINGWTLKFAFPGNQRVTQGWSARFTQTGNEVTATNEAWNASLATGASTSIGFNGTYTGSNPKPTSFSVNGVTCGGTVQKPPTVTLSVPAGPFVAPADVPLTATAADEDGTISKVEFYRNGLLVNTDTTAPYAYTLEDLPAGNYTVQAKAYDNANLSAVSEKTFTVSPATGPTLVATPSAVSVNEGGSTTFNLKLSGAPSGTVPVTLTRTGDSDITVSPTSLTLTTANWSTGATVTVAAAEDADTVGGTATITASATGYAPLAITATEIDNDVPGGGDNVYVERFLQQYGKIKNSGYFSPEGVPYHSIETLIVEAPDHGHQTTSEAFSFWLWLEANYGRVTQNWAPFNNAWTVMEKYIIPSNADQPTAGSPGTPQYAAEHDLPSQYPSALEPNVPVGQDPLRNELQAAYGTGSIYGMHWLLDVDNVYGYGRCGDGTTRPAYINTFQRGTQESVWETVPQPSCDTFKHGGQYGYLDLFIKESSAPAKQWKYTNAPDADARAVQAAYWALVWAKEQNKQADVAATVAKAAKMGDYLRYALFDKYFKKVGNCVGASTCPAASGRDSAHYLLSWYYSWGGAYEANQNWSWRIGSSHSHFGYQNPFAAWALTNTPELAPKSPTAAADWTKSLERQLELYTWLQSADGGIAGGATNSWGGHYGQPPAGTATFHGMYYAVDPVYNDPPSNQWFGMQAWSMHRIAELYQQTGNERAKALLDKWVPWAIANTTLGANWSIPADLKWTGQPTTWAGYPHTNPNLRVEVLSTGQDVGIAAAYARTLIAYAAKSGNTAAKNTAKGLLDALHAASDAQGVSTPETRGDYRRFDDTYNASTGQGLYIPQGWTGRMPNGDVIAPGKSFVDIRSFYKNDPAWPKVQAYLDGGPEPVFTYHRFWAQADVAMAYADYGKAFPNG
ncbi:cellulose 1,4-beta-cellobiosidase [Micromonospora rosaria]|uniref:Cellulose 1,4-beta-cellobiosidase n=1 Tax=Micromonospora rosaria TaxID=47874 RepID=A0A136PTZ0_9ACTN|nr:glycoside hydrolase family 48 protein [Micromonospora rosaria]KXK61596.1 cellulose 1,4-beta-cellobiosidase [Micromonospora rosaria]